MGSLTTTNKYLSSAAKRMDALRMSIWTSSAIEGIHAPFNTKRGKKAKKPTAAAMSRGSGSKPSRRVKTT